MATIQEILAQRNIPSFDEPGRAQAREMIWRIHKLGGRRLGAELVDRFEAANLIARIHREGRPPADIGLTPISGSLGAILMEIWRRCELRQHTEAERGPIDDDEFCEVADRSGMRI